MQNTNCHKTKNYKYKAICGTIKAEFSRYLLRHFVSCLQYEIEKTVQVCIAAGQNCNKIGNKLEFPMFP